MWHEIADNLVQYTKSTAFDQSENTDLLELYESMVAPLHSKINPLKYAIITVQVSRQHSDLERAITFLKEAHKHLDGKTDAQFLCRIGQAEKRLNLGQHYDCLQLLTEVKNETEPMSDIDPKVYAMLADVNAQYYRRKEDYENFYKSGLTYLAYTPADELSDEEKLQWSTKLGMAVLLGKKIFNVAELVSFLRANHCSWTKKF
jgi:26S proteasome regulatory subunit N9